MYEFNCSLKKVVDADTIDLDIDLGFHNHIIKRVVLEGIDAPEQFGPDASEAGKHASEFTKNWFANKIGGEFIYVSLSHNLLGNSGRVVWYPSGPKLIGGERVLNHDLNDYCLLEFKDNRRP